MAYDIALSLPQSWLCAQETYKDESGAEVTHLECHLPDDAKEAEAGIIDICVGPMPSDTCAADEALANYVDMVGFDKDDPEDFDPITEWPFNGRKAYGFEAYCEDESPLRVMCYEPRKGALCIMTLVGANDAALTDIVKLVEKSLRIK